VFLSDDQDDIFGGLCINLDITPYLAFDRHLQALLKPEKDDGSAQTSGRDRRKQQATELVTRGPV
jgi:predicted transcriptional regulator YheO